MKYVIITLEDAKRIAEVMKIERFQAGADRIVTRLEAETGADIQDIATQLKTMDLCACCKIEGQERYCAALDAQRLGRRLQRLLGRALGEWPPGEDSAE